MDIAPMERCVYREECSIPDADWGGLLPAAGGGHQAVLINPGWECDGRGDAAVQVGMGLWPALMAARYHWGAADHLPWLRVWCGCASHA